MSVAVTLDPGVWADLVEPQLAFHLHAGAELILLRGEPDVAVEEIVAPYLATDSVRHARRSEDVARAVADSGADWLLQVGAGEFWWPRAGSFGELLGALPKRYGAVRGLLRAVPLVEGASVTDGMVVRRSGVDGASPETMPTALRTSVTTNTTLPLRGWYPFEVLRMEPGPPLPESDVRRQLEAGTLFPETRVRDLLRSVSVRDRPDGRSYALPDELEHPVALPRPTLVDDADFAVDVAALGEGDVEQVREQIERLTGRVRLLETNSWSWLAQRALRRLLDGWPHTRT
jgi:hypothetical protein